MTSALACLGVCFGFLAPSLQPAPWLAPGPATAAALFTKLEGSWKAEGRRSFPGKKAYVRIEASVETALFATGGGMPYAVSRNTLSEQPYDEAGAPEAPRAYARIYWIRERAGEPGAFDLGAGDSPDAVAPSSSGLWDGATFRVKQDFGGQPAYTIDSETDLSGQDESFYLEKFWHGQNQLAETAIHYVRAP